MKILFAWKCGGINIIIGFGRTRVIFCVVAVLFLHTFDGVGSLHALASVELLAGLVADNQGFGMTGTTCCSVNLVIPNLESAVLWRPNIVFGMFLAIFAAIAFAENRVGGTEEGFALG